MAEWGADGEASWGPCQCGWTQEAGFPDGHETWCQCPCWDCQATNTQANNPQDDNDGSDWSGYGSDKSDEIWGNEPAVRTKLGESGSEFEVASDPLISSTIQEYLPTPCVSLHALMVGSARGKSVSERVSATGSEQRGVEEHSTW